MTAPAPALTLEELRIFLAREFPQVAPDVAIEAIGPMTATMRLRRHEKHLRPGGTISGPSMALLADVTAYIALLGMIGEQALAVTTNLSLNFMRKPANVDLLCDGRLLKLGKRLAVGDAVLYSEGGDPAQPVAHATFTYALP